MIDKFLLMVVLSILTFSSYGQKKTDLRKYRTGERSQYEIRLFESFNGKLSTITTAKCELVTVKIKGIFYDEVKWVSKLMVKGKDTLFQDEFAKKVAPYRISLASKGTLDLPKIEVPEMTQPIQDFNTFFVAISPQLGNHKVIKRGDYYRVPSQIHGNFANGSSILIGNDCFDVDIKYIDDSLQYRKTLVKFVPPQTACFNYLLPEMATSVLDSTINNFQMVMPSGNLFNVQFGMERFSIESIVVKKSGVLIEAKMRNELKLKLKMNCDKEYGNCADVMPFVINRVVTVRKL